MTTLTGPGAPAYLLASPIGSHGSGDMAGADRPAPIPEHEPELADASLRGTERCPTWIPTSTRIPPHRGSGSGWTSIRVMLPSSSHRIAKADMLCRRWGVNMRPSPSQADDAARSGELRPPTLTESDGLPTAAMASMSALWLIHTRPRQPGRGRERAKDRRSAGLPPRRP